MALVLNVSSIFTPPLRVLVLISTSELSMFLNFHFLEAEVLSCQVLKCEPHVSWLWKKIYFLFGVSRFWALQG